jgi:hypothetical protein
MHILGVIMNKIIYCPTCQDLKTLRKKVTRCVCGKAMGRMLDNTNAEINIDAIPIGLSNKTFQFSLQNRPESGLGTPFTGFVMASENKNITYVTTKHLMSIAQPVMPPSSDRV